MRTQLFTNRVMTFMMPLMMMIMNCITVMIIWFGGKGIDAGNLQVGDMMAFITYTMQIVMAFLMTVSYTHLDVYKRQFHCCPGQDYRSADPGKLCRK